MRRMLILLLVAVPAFGQKTLGDGIKDLSTQLSASLTKGQKQRVAVLPFKELDGQTTVLGTYLAEELLSHLVNSGLKIVERGMLDKILSEQKLQQSGAIDPATAKKVGQVAGVDAIITGSVTDLQSNVGINARVIDTSTGEVFAAAQVKITKDDDVKKILGIMLKPSGGSTTGTEDVPPQGPPKSPYWDGDGVRVIVDSFTRTGNAINMTIAVENLRDQEHNGWLWYSCWMRMVTDGAGRRMKATTTQRSPFPRDRAFARAGVFNRTPPPPERSSRLSANPT